MKCKFCKHNEADKTNTHYLTDGIIRKALNEDGSNEREKGYMFDMSNHSSSLEFQYQRNTSQEALEQAFGRETTEEENKESENLVFSVNHVFCSSCEDRFKAIEDPFMNKILPKFRGKDLTTFSDKALSEKVLIRKFFLLQVWRTSICDPGFTFDQTFQESLRELLYNSNSSESMIVSIPLVVVYMNTIGGNKEFTKNFVGTGVWKDNRVLFMNDFVVQIPFNGAHLTFNDWFGINKKSSFSHYINSNEIKFLIKILSNESRLSFCVRYSQYKAEIHLVEYRDFFVERYFFTFRRYPTLQLVDGFIEVITKGNDCTDAMRYNLRRVIRCMIDYFRRLPFNPYHTT